DHLLSSFFLYPQEVHPLLGVGWTLVHEVHFYLVFALLLVAPQRYLKWLLALWGGLVISGALAGLAAPLSTNLVQLFFAPLSLEFLMGAAAGLLYVQGVRSFAWTATFIGALGFIAGLAFSPAPDAFTLIWGRVLVFGPPSALIIYGLTALEAEGRLKTPKVLSSIGDWSYALYLSHMLVLSALRRILPLVGDQFETMGAPDLVSGPLQLGAPGVWDNVAYNVLSLTAALIVAWVIYRGFERPALRGAKQLRRRVFHAKDTRTPSAPLQPNVG
ncbi:MAG: acyltransferase, partial [Pseudomonadota bacterium]